MSNVAPLIALTATLSRSEETALTRILLELRKAKMKWPDWVTDPIHAAGILVEEAGEAMQAAQQMTYEHGEREEMDKEAAQAGAMAIRLIAARAYRAEQKYIGGKDQ